MKDYMLESALHVALQYLMMGNCECEDVRVAVSAALVSGGGPLSD